ncbi:MAG: helix-turn-helix transcriptional regulator, partial [Lachnospiraceae bacterium]|nr:helix-turn-helix transcriptional regulator [Lachnospiraceae bacterium]
ETVRMSPIEYLNRYRIRVAAGRLAESDDPISIIAEECGFLSDSYFSKMFKNMMKVSPREYRNNAFKGQLL